MPTYTIRKEEIPVRIEKKGMPLGRHINHDSRSWDYRVSQPAAGVVTTEWDRLTAILNQGDLGSCTGNASAGALGTNPFFPTLKGSKFKGDEDDAVAIYSLATHLDSYSGDYPPNDTGSDGLSAAKACQQIGYISGYTHAMSTDDMISGLQKGPGIVGVNWMTGMDEVNTTTGEIKPTGQVRGGHEFEVYAVDLEKGVFHFYNSWGATWGVDGGMFMTIENFATLLKADGDATFFVPVTEPAPVPTPTPTPTGSVVKTFTQADADAIGAWAAKPHIWHLASVAAKSWANGK